MIYAFRPDDEENLAYLARITYDQIEFSDYYGYHNDHEPFSYDPADIKGLENLFKKIVMAKILNK